MKDINIYLIRHGQAEGNTEKNLDRIGQSADSPLTQLGVEQATRLGSRLIEIGPPDYIASSTYIRAHDTAKIVHNTAGWTGKINLFDELIEYNPGDWKGESRSEIFSDINNLMKINYLNMGFKFPGDKGESYKQVERRASTWLENYVIYNKEILAKANDKELNVVIFSHGMTIKCFLFYVFGFDQSFLWKIRIGNTSICHLVFNDRGFFINSINDEAHLR